MTGPSSGPAPAGRLAAKVTVRSTLEATAAVVWEDVASLDAVNVEMAPWLRLTPPPGTGLRDAVGGVVRLRLQGPAGIPLGAYPLGLVRFEEGVGFLEHRHRTLRSRHGCAMR